MKTNTNRKVLESLLNGETRPLQQFEEEARRNSLPTVVITMPDGSLDVGDSKAFNKRYVSQKEFNEVVEELGGDKTVFILPDNGRD